jgi:hypothetical protein
VESPVAGPPRACLGFGNHFFASTELSSPRIPLPGVRFWFCATQIGVSENALFGRAYFSVAAHGPAPVFRFHGANQGTHDFAIHLRRDCINVNVLAR